MTLRWLLGHHRCMVRALSALCVAIASSVACSSSKPADDAVLHDAVTPAISAAQPLVDDRGGGSFAITYTDVAGDSRTVLVEMRRPARARGSVPVMVWSHGGATGKSSTVRVGDGWGRAFNRAGFAFVAVAHAGRDTGSRARLCAALAVDDCSTFLFLDWDRPADIAAVLDWLPGPYAANLDLDRMAYGGHSAGGRSALWLAGVDLEMSGNRRPAAEPRFKAFLVASPPGVDRVGTLTGLAAPLLLLSGAGDSTAAASAADRRATIDLLPAGPHAAIWVDAGHVRHTTLDLDTAACRRSGGTVEQCREVVRFLGQAGTRFVQFALEGRSIDEYRSHAVERLPAPFEVL